MEVIFIFILLMVLVAFPLFVCFQTHNELKGCHESVKKSWSTINGYREKRDSILADIATVAEKYAGHEQATHINVASLENDGKGKEGASAFLGNLTRAYPELKSDAMFLNSQEQLVQLSEELRTSAEDFDSEVKRFNTRRNSLPTKLYAPALGFDQDLEYSSQLFKKDDGNQLLERAYDDTKVDDLRTKGFELLSERKAAIEKQGARLIEGARSTAKAIDERTREQEAESGK